MTKVTIRLTGMGSTWRVGRIELTAPTQQKSVELTVRDCSYDRVLQVAMRQAVEMVDEVGCRVEDVEWDIHPERPHLDW